MPENGEERGALVLVERNLDEGVGTMKSTVRNAEKLAMVLGDMVVDIAGAIGCRGKQPLTERLEGAVTSHAPRLQQAVHRVGADVLQWMHQGGFWRTLLVVSVGLISVTALTGLTALLMVVLVATVNAVIIGFLMSLSAVGAFLAMFCTSLTVIYIGALAATAFAIGSAVVVTSCTVLFFTGWILFAWAICEVMKKSLNFARNTLTGVSKRQEAVIA